MVQLYEELVAEGVREDELTLSKQALINSYPFLLDAPHKLLSLRCDTALYGIEPDDEQTHRAKISSVDPVKIRNVLQRTHHPDTMTMVLLGDAKRLEAVAAGLPGITSQEVISGGLPHLS
jgi:predicted Zn-dependent peptidase